MTPQEHNEHWIKYFNKQLLKTREYSADWWILRKRLAVQVQQWRKFNKLKAV